MLSATPRPNRRHVIAGLAVAGCLLAAAPAAAQTGGAPSPDTGGSTAPGYVPPPPPNGARATLMPNGSAVAPSNAPLAVQNAIAAANRIRKKPYIYGGGHKSFNAKGYDCSGAVSYVLNAAGFLPSPLPSGPLMRWGMPGKGSWISVYANKGHTYAVIAGLRWDTSAAGSGGKGPRWRATKRSPKSFTVRHWGGY